MVTVVYRMQPILMIVENVLMGWVDILQIAIKIVTVTALEMPTKMIVVFVLVEVVAM